MNELKDIIREGLQPIADRLDATEKWVESVEAKADAARHGSIVADNLKAAIPERYVGAIELAARHGHADPVQTAAREAWVKNAVHLARGKNVDRASLIEENARLAAAMGDDLTVRAPLAEGASATGGVLVPTPMEAAILRIMEDTSVVRPLARKIAMSAKTISIPRLTSSVTVAIVDEAGAIGESEPAFDNVTLDAKKFAARGLASMEIVQDSAVGIWQLWQELAAEQLARAEDAQALEGSGVAPNFTGLSVVSGTSSVTNGTNGAAPTYSKLVEQLFKTSKRSARQGAAWVMHPAVLAKIIGLVDSTGQPIVLYGENRIASLNLPGADGTILGAPVFTTDTLAINRTVGSSTDCSNIYFGSFASGMIFGDRLGITFDASDAPGWNNAQIAIRLLKRTAIAAALPGVFTVQTGVKTA